MSRRRVSVRDLGAVDCQGWLHRRKEGRSFLGSKWRRYWFVLKKTSLYWYTDKMAAKAEGFINLSGFTIEQAKQCRRKHAVTASHPLVVTIVIAAETFTEMNKWIRQLSGAAEPSELISSEECYSEGSDQDGDDCASTSCSVDSQLDVADCEHVSDEACAAVRPGLGVCVPELRTADAARSPYGVPTAGLAVQGDHVQPRCESSSCTWIPSATLTPEHRSRSSSAGGTLSRDRRRRPAAEIAARLSWLDLPGEGGARGAASIPLLHVREEREEGVVRERPPDEMERLCSRLRAASLTPIGQPSRRDFRASFVRRCRDDQLNDKLHLLRILNSTLKAKESELLAVEQILSDPTLTAPTYRKWRLSNVILLQEVGRHSRAAGAAAELRPEAV